MSKFHLVLLIHAHQPVGNFDAVFEKIYQCSYLPFLECLERHPNVRLGLHYSGPLLEWLEKRHPEFLERLREMVGCAQVEMVGGGFFEPILISLPPEDQAEQLRTMSDYLVQRFGVTPAGAWLAERVWEPQLPYMLSSCDLRYTLVDDTHFLAAGIDPDQLHGDYLAEDRGRVVRVLPGLKFLRYFVPFHSVEETMEVLHDSAARHPGGMAAMGDDCEKFGGWPGTYDHCYRDGWLDRFFGAIEASGDWLVATPPGEYIAAHAPLGRADLPTASYPEMMEWALPTAARNEYHALSKEFSGRPSVLRFLRGGHWRGFFSKYAEASLMHKKMLYVSAKLRKAASRRLVREKQAKLTRARKHLMRAQCNDAYWHGIFGGIYAPNLRTEIWRELVRAETLADKVSSSTGRVLRLERLDFNADGCEELYVTSRRMAALVQPAEGGTIGALDFRPKGVTLLNSMQRRVEAYHGRLRDVSRGKPGQVSSIHEQVRVKEEGLERALHYDRWPRHSFRLLLFPAEKTFEDYQSLRLEEHAGLAGGPYAVREAKPGRISLACEVPSGAMPSGTDAGELLRCAKNFRFAHTKTGYQINCAVEISSAMAQARRVQAGIEMVINLLEPDGSDRYFETSVGRHPLRWAAAVPALGSEGVHLRVVDEWQDVAATIDAPGASQLWISPIETVSESEEGFERVYQGSQIQAVWVANLAASSAWHGEVTLRIEPAPPRGGAKP